MQSIPDVEELAIGPKGNAQSTKAVTTSAKSLLLKFLATVVINVKVVHSHYPLNLISNR